MAKRQGNKQHRGEVNSGRRNGKSWKQNPKKNGDGSVGKPNRNRSFRKMQARNEFGHVVRTGSDGHEIAICDHARGYRHEKIQNEMEKVA